MSTVPVRTRVVDTGVHIVGKATGKILPLNTSFKKIAEGVARGTAGSTAAVSSGSHRSSRFSRFSLGVVSGPTTGILSSSGDSIELSTK